MSAFIDYSKFVPRDTQISWAPLPYEDPYVKLVKSLRTTPGSTNVTVAQKTPENHVAIHKTEVVASEAQKVAFVDSMGSLLGAADEPTETDKNAATAAAVAGKKGPGRPKGSVESEAAKALKAKSRALAKIIEAGETPPEGSPGGAKAVSKRREAAAKAKAELATAKTPADKQTAQRKLINAHLDTKTTYSQDDTGYKTDGEGAKRAPKKAKKTNALTGIGAGIGPGVQKKGGKKIDFGTSVVAKGVDESRGRILDMKDLDF